MPDWKKELTGEPPWEAVYGAAMADATSKLEATSWPPPHLPLPTLGALRVTLAQWQEMQSSFTSRIKGKAAAIAERRKAMMED
jgi:hypothetical protein